MTRDSAEVSLVSDVAIAGPRGKVSPAKVGLAEIFVDHTLFRIERATEADEVQPAQLAKAKLQYRKGLERLLRDLGFVVVAVCIVAAAVWSWMRER